jgi:integrase
MYLHRRGSNWWIRKAVPVDLVGVLGLDQLRRSLRTKDAAVARRRALQLLVRVDDVYAVLRSNRPLMPTRQIALALLDEALSLASGTQPMFSMKFEMIQRAHNAVSDFLVEDERLGESQDPSGWLAAHYGIGPQRPVMVTKADALQLLKSEAPRAANNALAKSLLQAVDQLASADVKKVREGMQSAIATVRHAVASGRAADSHLVVAQRQENLQAAGIHSAMLQLQEDLQSALAELRSVVAEHRGGVNSGAAPSVDAASVAEAILEAERARWSAELLSTMVEVYQTKVLKNDKGGLKHIEDVKKRLANFVEFIGDKPVRDVSREDLKTYRDHLDQLPKNYELHFGTSDMRKAIALNKKRRERIDTLNSKTINLKYIGPVRRLFAWLVDETKIERNPAAGIQSEEDDGEDAKRKRFPLKTDQINRLFASTAREPRTSALYWLPPLMLFTGARLNELAQLRTDDLRNYNNRLHLSVLCLIDDDENDDEAKKRKKKTAAKRHVKSNAARRLIPVHQELLQIGFAEFARARQSRANGHCQVFEDLRPDRFGHWSAAISKRLNRRLRSLGITNERLTAFSLRHNFRDACVKGRMDAETRKKIMGHQLEGMDGVYGNPNPLPHESMAIDLVSYPDVDMKPYQTHAGVRKA